MTKYEYNNDPIIPKINIINPLLEKYRHDIYQEIENFFVKFLIHKSSIDAKKKYKKAFNRWIMLQISCNYTTVDPIIPSSGINNTQLLTDLNYFIRGKTVDGNQIISELDLQTKCLQSVNKIQAFVHDNKIQTFDNTITIEKEKTDQIYKLSYDNLPVMSITKEIYDRTKILYFATNDFATIMKTHGRFRYLAYCLLLRYYTISKEHFRQGCMTQEFFDDLYTLGINFECFATGFLASSNRFCSLFYDIEKYFGSQGNFFTFTPIKGFYQFNPPLDFLITEMACQHMLDILEKNENYLGFICLIPAWDHETTKTEFDDFPIYYKLRDSKFTIYNFDIKNKKIKYKDYMTGEITSYPAPHVLIMGTEEFRKKTDKINFRFVIGKHVSRR